MNTNTTIDKVIKLAKLQLPKKQADLAAVFIKEFYGNSIWNDFAERNAANLCGSVLSLWELFKQRQPKEHKVMVFNPDKQKDGWECANTIIAIVHEDMPFLVDSLQMALNKLGARIYTLAHLGGLKVDRNVAGEVTKIIPIKGKKTAVFVEAPIYIEIENKGDVNLLGVIKAALESVLADVRAAVNDWEAIKQKLQQAANELKALKLKDTREEQNFLYWLYENNFVWLGYRCYKLIESEGEKAFAYIDNSSLGVLKNKKDVKKIYQYYSDLSAEAIEVISSNNPLLLSKTNTISTVHKACYTDSVIVKSYDKNGKISKIHRFIGLYASTAYYSGVHSIPFLRCKADDVLTKFGFPRNGYSAKTLLQILETLPRDDFIQASIDELYEIAVGIFQLHERRLTKLFVRKDLYGRYVSCLVYLPRDNFNTDVRLRIQGILLRNFYGLEIDFDVLFSESILARIHFVVRIDAASKLVYDLAAIEHEIAEASFSWHDMLRENLLANYGRKEGDKLATKYLKAFPAGYRESFAHDLVLQDIQKIECLSTEHGLGMLFYTKPNSYGNIINFKLFYFNQEISLSDALPILENMGLDVIGEQSYQIILPEQGVIWISDLKMQVQYKDALVQIEDVYAEFQEVFAKVWGGEVESDGFNHLVLNAGFNWREITVFRAYAKYLHQIRFPFTQQYLTLVLATNPSITKLLLDVFKLRFDPNFQRQKDSSKKLLDIKNEIHSKLEAVTSLDEDRVLTKFLYIIEATVRTNYYQNKPYFSYKFACRDIQDLPLPKPLFEIFVYAPRFEGTHLRMAKVARGGLRWSDRREDFRTEILGLMKAQQVKNAVIVPHGAKGGFVLKKISADISREELQCEGIACYKCFISALLDITDNIRGGKVIRPNQVVCYDEIDTYLVVAADKGTTTFSDVANSISLEYGFWLGDAFASGGATGYDHKQIGITARGAWEAVQHHFYEQGVNVQTTDFTVIGIGDMYGDVFGNGMLLSKYIKLVGAFNHLHIFLDPNPDTMISFGERLRLFKLPQSTWGDYKRELISKGGGIYLRSAKSIPLSSETKVFLGINKDSAAPNEVIRALLKAKVDLLWNGGIGTYAKASSESNESVGDRSNDAVRVNANELRCKVVAEGGNLGFTQLARIEFAENGGIINTDFIDNSGGVDCSDHEVNLKILLNELVAQKIMSEKARNNLLASMTDEVSKLVLRNNYRQTRAIGMICAQSAANLGELSKYIDAQEQANKLHRTFDCLPNNKIIAERKSKGRGLTRPEVATLLAYSKIILKEQILESKLVENVEFIFYLEKEFPSTLLKKFGKYLPQHRLRREIISTQLSNDFITNLGITFIQEVQAVIEVKVEDIIYAYMIAKNVLNSELMREKIEMLDFIVPAETQKQMILAVNNLLRKGVYWFLHYLVKGKIKTPKISEIVDKFSAKLSLLYDNFNLLLDTEEAEKWSNKIKKLTDGKVDLELAYYIATTDYLDTALNIMAIESLSRKNFMSLAKIYYSLRMRLNLDLLADMFTSISTSDHCLLLATDELLQEIEQKQITLTLLIMKNMKKFETESACVDDWLQLKQDFYQKWKNLTEQIKQANAIKPDVLYILAKELANVV